MILYDCVIFTLVSLHVTHYLIFQFAKVIFECLIERRDFFLEAPTSQVIVSKPILNMTESECGVGPFKYHTPIAWARWVSGFLHHLRARAEIQRGYRRRQVVKVTICVSLMQALKHWLLYILCHLCHYLRLCLIGDGEDRGTFQLLRRRLRLLELALRRRMVEGSIQALLGHVSTLILNLQYWVL